mgnify:CR=1 FL=1
MKDQDKKEQGTGKLGAHFDRCGSSLVMCGSVRPTCNGAKGVKEEEEEGRRGNGCQSSPRVVIVISLFLVFPRPLLFQKDNQGPPNIRRPLAARSQ